MNQIERIQCMEEKLDQAEKALQDFLQAIEQYQHVSSSIRELTEYYTSSLWQQDVADDNAGKIPHDLKRGVLSEDAVYDLLVDERFLLEELREMIKEL